MGVTANIIIGLKYSDLVLFIEMVSGDITGDSCANNCNFHIVIFCLYFYCYFLLLFGAQYLVRGLFQ